MFDRLGSCVIMAGISMIRRKAAPITLWFWPPRFCRVTSVLKHFQIGDCVMKKPHKRILALGAALALNLVCQGQTSAPADPKAGPPQTISGTIFDPSGAP